MQQNNFKHELDGKMPSVTFLPWIGTRYQEGIWNGRLLILGESHYGEEDATLTRTLTQDYCSSKMSHPYWTNIMQVVTGRHHSELDRNDFWQTVAFYNYVQSALDEPGDAPTDEMWSSACLPFNEVFSAIKPDRILVVSYRLWEMFDFGGSCGAPIQINGQELPIWLLNRSNGEKTICGCIKHPRAGFSSEAVSPLVKAFIDYELS